MSESKDTQENTSGRDWGYEFWDTAKVLLISLAIVLPIRYFIAQPFIVRGASMQPNFENREYLIIDEVSYYFRNPLRGEAVVFRFPQNPRQFFIKRIIGLPEEGIEIRGGRIKVFNSSYPDGFTLEESYLDPPGRATNPDIDVKLGKDEYFVLGDNRDFSSDSRIWGALDRKLITGRVIFRVWPIARFGLVPDFAVSY